MPLTYSPRLKPGVLGYERGLPAQNRSYIAAPIRVDVPTLCIVNGVEAPAFMYNEALLRTKKTLLQYIVCTEFANKHDYLFIFCDALQGNMSLRLVTIRAISSVNKMLQAQYSPDWRWNGQASKTTY